jgi:hypothetical protein
VPRMDPLERYGRILLAMAVGALFVTIVASMITGRMLMPGLVFVAIAGVIGAAGMLAAKYRNAG